MDEAERAYQEAQDFTKYNYWRERRRTSWLASRARGRYIRDAAPEAQSSPSASNVLLITVVPITAEQANLLPRYTRYCAEVFAKRGTRILTSIETGIRGDRLHTHTVVITGETYGPGDRVLIQDEYFGMKVHIQPQLSTEFGCQDGGEDGGNTYTDYIHGSTIDVAPGLTQAACYATKSFSTKYPSIAYNADREYSQTRGLRRFTISTIRRKPKPLTI